MKNLSKYLFLLLFVTLSSCCDMLCERQQHAELLLEKVEAFKSETGRLPQGFEELGLEEQMHLSFYKKLSENEFEIWYGTGLGSSRIYNSRTKTWREEG